MKGKRSAHSLAFPALLGAVYAAVTVLTGFMSYNGIQLRVAEALCVLAFFYPAAGWGLFVGCFIANLLSPAGLPDAVFGSLASLISCLLMARLGRGGSQSLWRRGAACLCPVIINGLLVGAVLALSTTDKAFPAAFPIYAAQVAAGEAAVMFTLGAALMWAAEKRNIFK